MSKYKIKTVREFIQEGPPQFDIILRRGVGKTVNISVMSNVDFDYKEEGVPQSIVNTTLLPPENGQGIIQIVKRISDDIVFHQSDMVEADKVGSAFILEFKEDLIHVAVCSMFDQQPTLVEINNLTAHSEVSVGDEEEEDEQAG